VRDIRFESHENGIVIKLAITSILLRILCACGITGAVLFGLAKLGLENHVVTLGGGVLVLIILALLVTDLVYSRNLWRDPPKLVLRITSNGLPEIQYTIKKETILITDANIRSLSSKRIYNGKEHHAVQDGAMAMIFIEGEVAAERVIIPIVAGSFNPGPIAEKLTSALKALTMR
jgi:hypothetical protein